MSLPYAVTARDTTPSLRKAAQKEKGKPNAGTRYEAVSADVFRTIVPGLGKTLREREFKW